MDKSKKIDSPIDFSPSESAAQSAVEESSEKFTSKLKLDREPEQKNFPKEKDFRNNNYQAGSSVPKIQIVKPTTETKVPRPMLQKKRPLVMATHLVPSLPVGLFELVAEVIEEACSRPVVILHESRTNRSVAEDIVDIAFLPAGDSWDIGKLLPVSFVFKHVLNKDSSSPAVYVDVVIDKSRANDVETIIDLRGHKCALPDRSRAVGAATFLFSHLKWKGEGPSFFGSTLDANSQASALQMVEGKQVDVCVVESPVIKNYTKHPFPRIDSFHTLTSLGPLPPYQILVNKNMQETTILQISESLLRINENKMWLKRFSEFSCLGFTTYNKDTFSTEDIKSVATTAPYY